MSKSDKIHEMSADQTDYQPDTAFSRDDKCEFPTTCLINGGCHRAQLIREQIERARTKGKPSSTVNQAVEGKKCGSIQAGDAVFAARYNGLID